MAVVSQKRDTTASSSQADAVRAAASAACNASYVIGGLDDLERAIGRRGRVLVGVHRKAQRPPVLPLDAVAVAGGWRRARLSACCAHCLARRDVAGEKALLT